jgi:AraC-like DNA-binding protein
MDNDSFFFNLAIIFRSLAVSQVLFFVVAAKIAFPNQKTSLAAFSMALGFTCYSFLFITNKQSDIFPLVLALNQTLPMAAYFFVQSIIIGNQEGAQRVRGTVIAVVGSCLIIFYSFFSFSELQAFRYVITSWNVFVLSLAGLSLWWDYREDLNSTRTFLRVAASAGVVIYVVIVGVISTTRPVGESTHMLLRALEGGLITLIGLSINTALVQPPMFSRFFGVNKLAAQAQSVEATESPKSPLVQQLQELEILAVRVKEIMESERLFLSQGLTLQDLAKKLEIPVYRLRYLLNNHLGHENFSGFLNPYRLRHAATLLINPERIDDKIFALALESGFSSLAPFNKAFKALYGMTPSEYRDRHLQQK